MDRSVFPSPLGMNGVRDWSARLGRITQGRQACRWGGAEWLE